MSASSDLTPPLDSDCCGSGCDPCIFDVYARSLARKSVSNSSSTGRSSEILSELRYTTFKLTRVERETSRANIYTFRAVRERDDDYVDVSGDLGLRNGQHVMMKAVSDDGTKFSRAYTPIRSSPGQFELVVKLYERGAMSEHFSRMRVDDVEHFRGPYGDFRHVSNRYKKVAMVCCGTGLAPMVGIARGIVEDESDETVVRLLYSVRTIDEILLRDELIELGGFWNFRARIHVTRGDVSGSRYLEDVVQGRIAEGDVRNVIGTDVLVLICGTDDFRRDMLTYVGDCESFVF